MEEIVILIKELFVGSGSLRDLAIRVAVLIMGGLFTLLGHYLKKDFKSYGDMLRDQSESIKKIGSTIGALDATVHGLDDLFSKFKREVAEILFKNTESIRTEFHTFKIDLLELKAKLDDTSKELKQSNQLGKDVYGFMKVVAEIERQKELQYGKIIMLEDFAKRYEMILVALEKSILNAKKKSVK